MAKNRINKPEAIALFRAHGIRLQRELNFYTMRLKAEEDDAYYDWFHTTGTLVRNLGHSARNAGTFTDPEKVAQYIIDTLYD